LFTFDLKWRVALIIELKRKILFWDWNNALFLKLSWEISDDKLILMNGKIKLVSPLGKGSLKGVYSERVLHKIINVTSFNIMATYCCLMDQRSVHRKSNVKKVFCRTSYKLQNIYTGVNFCSVGKANKKLVYVFYYLKLSCVYIISCKTLRWRYLN
jgi:hypothetical protein